MAADSRPSVVRRPHRLLVSVDHPPTSVFSDEAYTYDVAGRRTSTATDPAAQVVHDNADRLVQDATYTYAYDLEGRLTSRTHRVTSATTAYTYNALGRLVSVSDGGVTWQFLYDGWGNRVLVSSDAGYSESFVFGPDEMVRATYDASGTRTATYIPGPTARSLLARTDAAGSVESAVQDRLSSTVAFLDSAGQVSQHLKRDGFGVPDGLPTEVRPFGFAGHSEDPTGLVWGRARYYAPSMGTWLSEDSILTEPPYSYVHNSPLSLVDPLGNGPAREYALLVWDDATETFVAEFYVSALEREIAIQMYRTFGVLHYSPGWLPFNFFPLVEFLPIVF